MRKILTPALLLLALAAAAPGAAARPRGTPGCVSTQTNDSVTPFDANSVYVRTGVRNGYIARFKGDRCPSLRRDSTLIVEKFGAQTCTGDRIRPVDPTLRIPGPACIIDSLTPYTEPKTSRH